ncbi:MAG: TetR/AcrR family transcriptional regulator [Actinomycetaceae bacterium]|nr:TetR/AcrR family transcriptional regulator [Actinomycetaceae bacterium]
MPKINAPTVREHHENIKKALVKATEEILRNEGPYALSAARVAKEAGIARNSIYRYVESVDDLKMLVMEDFIPQWHEKIFSSINTHDDPAKRLISFAIATIEETHNNSHTWLMNIMRTHTGKTEKKKEESSRRKIAHSHVSDIHKTIENFITQQFIAMGAEHPHIWSSFVKSLMFDSFKQEEMGMPHTIISAELEKAITALTNQARTIPEGKVLPL